MIEAFATPILDFDFTESTGINELNANIVEFLLIAEKADSNAPSYSLGGPNGYHSRDNLANLNFEWSKQLKSLIFSAGNMWLSQANLPTVHPLQCEVKCWGMTMRSGSYSSLHTHPGAMVSGVYYPLVNYDKGEAGGVLTVPDTRIAARGDKNMGSQHLDLFPKQSCGYCFPGWLDHYVTPYTRDTPRISVAFNINFLNIGVAED